MLRWRVVATDNTAIAAFLDREQITERKLDYQLISRGSATPPKR